MDMITESAAASIGLRPNTVSDEISSIIYYLW